MLPPSYLYEWCYLVLLMQARVHDMVDNTVLENQSQSDKACGQMCSAHK
jgi:hypothetical protein